MSRPAPKVILEVTNKLTQKTEQVVEADAVWAVFYQGRPINLKTLNFTHRCLPKYLRVSFANKGHAANLVLKLNKLFKTSDFSVYKLTTGEPID